MSGCKGFARCPHCFASITLFTIFARDMQGFAESWRKRHAKACASRTPSQRLAWSKKYDGKGGAITIDARRNDHEK